MEPKFQSTFIPRGPTVNSGGAVVGPRRKERSLFGFLAGLAFTFSLILALGTYGYGLYLKSSITSMTKALEVAKAELDPATVSELIRLNDRIVSTANLIGGHMVLSPFFKFLETNTLKTVRFTSFRYEMTPDGLKLSMEGEAQGYGALAQQADLLNKSGNLSKAVFSDLRLNQKGNVTFTVTAMVNERLLSYERTLEASTIAPPALPAISTSTQATTTQKAATTSTSTSTKPR